MESRAYLYTCSNKDTLYYMENPLLKTSLIVYNSFVSGHLCSQAIVSVSLLVINEKEWGLSKSFVAIDNVANTEKF